MKTDIAAAIRGELAEWRGLSGQETREVVATSLEPLKSIGEPEQKIRKNRRFNVIKYEREIRPHFVEGWFLYGDNELTLLEYDDPSLPDPDETLRSYEPPDLIWESKRQSAEARVREYIYAGRGITLFVAEPFTQTTGGRTWIVHVQLYQPMPVQFYVGDIGSVEGPRPYPRS